MMDSVVKLCSDIVRGLLRKPEENDHQCFLGYNFQLYGMVSSVYFFINSVIITITLKYPVLVSNMVFFLKSDLLQNINFTSQKLLISWECP